MSSTINLTVSVLMITLFSVAIIAFSIGFANDNDAYVNIAENDKISSFHTNSSAGITNFADDSNNTYSSILETTVEPGSDVIKSSSSFSITWKNLYNFVTNAMDIVSENIFGAKEGVKNPFGIFVTSFLAVLVFMIGLYLVKTWRGNP